jgi:hypothetical protein
MSVMTLPGGVSGARLSAKQAGAAVKTQKTRQHCCHAETVFANSLRVDIESNFFIENEIYHFFD